MKIGFLNRLNFKSLIMQLLFLYIGVVYFSIAISNIFLGIAIFVFLTGLLMKKIQLDLYKHNWYLYFFIIIPFLLTLFSTLYSENTSKGLRYIWLRLPILAIPFMLLFINLKSITIKTGFKIFVILTVIASLKTIYNAIIYINEDIVFVPDFTFFITIIQHPYFGIFSLIALVSIIELNIVKNKILKIAFIVLLVIGIALSTSRIVYFLLFTILFYYISIGLFKKKLILAIVVLSVFSIYLIVTNKAIASKFQSSVQYENSPRLKLWNNAYKVLNSSDNKLLGIGIGDYYKEKKDPYYFKEDDKGIYGYNPHSQLIEFIVTNGILGLVILIIYIIFGLKYIKKQNRFAIIVFVIILVFSMTESIFSRQYGVQLYSVFIPLLFKENFKKIRK